MKTLDYLSSPDLIKYVVQMLPYKSLIIINRQAANPVYIQISNSMVKLIRNGLLKPGSPLPGSRQMAELLQVHRKTVVAAYEELFAQDWIETIPRKGVLVSQNLPELKPRIFSANSKESRFATLSGFSFRSPAGRLSNTETASGHRLIINDGFPDPRISSVDSLLKEYRRLFHIPAIQRTTQYGNQAGSPKLRQHIAEFLSDSRGMDLGPEHILMSRGGQMAIFLVASLLLKPGSTVIVGEPNYPMANMCFENFGAKLIRVPVDETGIDVEQIEKICKKKKPDLLYIIPHHHHPTTVTLSAEKRMKLVHLIRTYNFPVIEDDYDFDFHYSSSPILPLASADHGGNVIYIGSFTKSLAPSIKIGYMVAPENFIRAIAQLRKIVDIRGDTLLEEALAELFKTGQIQLHLKKSAKLYHQRRDLMATLLEKEFGNKIQFRVPPGGMAIWVRFNSKYPLAAIAKRASSKSLFMSDGKFYNTGQEDYNSLRMGFASLNEKEIREVVDILKTSF
ncbi:MAG: PLP-dependent aminotransferase family protein [Bacteroidetes bacterium]|nr:MAG: PLP-dependent aminotransferase family protein [Bacteroidota bacterium]